MSSKALGKGSPLKSICFPAQLIGSPRRLWLPINSPKQTHSSKRKSCNRCSKLKKKCNGMHPCDRCLKSKLAIEDCTFSESRRGQKIRKPNSPKKLRAKELRFADVEIKPNCTCTCCSLFTEEESSMLENCNQDANYSKQAAMKTVLVKKYTPLLRYDLILPNKCPMFYTGFYVVV